MAPMKTCLGSLLLVPTILALVGTAIYHISVNSELRFEQRDTNTEYINVHRSYRPQVQQKKEEKPDASPQAAATDGEVQP